MAAVRTFRSILLAATSAVLLFLIYPPYDLSGLAWIALVPLFYLIRDSRPSGAFLYSLGCGSVFFGILLTWMLNVDTMNPFNYGAALLGHSLSFGVFGLTACYLQRKLPRWRVLVLPTAWVLIEYLRAHQGFLSVPWGTLGYSQYAVLPVVQVAGLTGVYGVSFLLVLVNATIAEVALHLLPMRKDGDIPLGEPSGRQRISFGIIGSVGFLVMASVAYGYAVLPGSAGSSVLKTTLVQGNIYAEPKYSQAYADNVFETYRRQTVRAAGSRPDLIVWPSSSVPGTIPRDQQLVGKLSDLATGAGTYLLIGAAGFDKFNLEQRMTRRVANSAFLFSPTGKILGRYDKIFLLPFDEYIPLRGRLDWPSWIVPPGMVDSLPGKEKTVFRMGKTRFCVLICWENMFPDLFREMAAQGVDFMVGMTNEAFIGKSPAGHYQMFALYVLRAVENHVSLVRTSSTGVSAIVDPYGRITTRVRSQEGKDVDVEAVAEGTVPLTAERTFYTRYGDWFVYLLFVLMAGFVLARRDPAGTAGIERRTGVKTFIAKGGGG